MRNGGLVLPPLCTFLFKGSPLIIQSALSELACPPTVGKHVHFQIRSQTNGFLVMDTNIIFNLFRVAHRICTSCISCHLVKSGLYRCFALHKCQQKNKVKRNNHNEIITHLFYVQRGRPHQEQTKMQNVQKYFSLWVSNTRQL